MMNNLTIQIDSKTRMVNLINSTIGNDGENLQGNLVFSFKDVFVEGQARLEYIMDNDKKYVFLDRKEDTYVTPIKSFLTKKGQIDMQLVISEGTDEENTPIFKSNMFYLYCNSSINAEIEQPEDMVSWLDMANTKLNQAENLNISATKSQAVTTIDVTSKDGSTTTTEVYDGKDGIDGINGKDGYTPIKGIDYFDGKDGYTPVKGVDYFTQSDVNQIVNKVLDEIPTSEGVDY